jgi:hypothetical protein
LFLQDLKALRIIIHYILNLIKRKLSKMTDYSLTTFGESGELTQVRHAFTAVGNGETVIGIRAKNGIVIAAEKKLASQLYVSDQ